MAKNTSTVTLYAEGMRGVIDNLQIVCVCDALYRIDIARPPIAMDWHDRCSVWTNRCLDFGRIEVKGFLIDINEYRFYAIPQQGMCCSDE